MQQELTTHPLINNKLIEGLSKNEEWLTKLALERIMTAYNHSKFHYICMNSIEYFIDKIQTYARNDVKAISYRNVRKITSEEDYLSRDDEDSIFIGDVHYKRYTLNMGYLNNMIMYCHRPDIGRKAPIKFKFYPQYHRDNLFVVLDIETKRDYLLYNNINCVSYSDLCLLSATELRKRQRIASASITQFDARTQAIVLSLFGFKTLLLPNYFIPFELLLNRIVKGDEIDVNEVNDDLKEHFIVMQQGSLEKIIVKMSNTTNFRDRYKYLLEFLLQYSFHQLENRVNDEVILTFKRYTDNVAKVISDFKI